MRKKILIIFALLASIILILIYHRYTNISLTINDYTFFMGKYDVSRENIKHQNKKEYRKVLKFSYTTFDEKYHINYRVLEPIKNDTIIYFDTFKDNYLITDFNIQTKYRDVFYKPKYKSLWLKLSKLKSKYNIEFRGVVYDKPMKDSLVIKSNMTLDIDR